MLRPINKRGGIASLVSLYYATIAIVVILVGFILLSGIVKVKEKAYNGERILNDTELGVGKVNDYMENYKRLVSAEKLAVNGEPIDDALKSLGHAKALDGIVYGYQVTSEGGWYVRE